MSCFPGAVVIAFFMCWAPFHAQRLLVIYGSEYKYFPEISTWMYCITGLFYYFSSTLNPILYNIMSDRMRNAFKEVICGVKPKRNVKRSSTYRDTCSRSYTQRVQKSPSHNIGTMMDDLMEDEKINLVNKEVISISVPHAGNTLIYQIEHFKTKDRDRCNNESRI